MHINLFILRVMRVVLETVDAHHHQGEVGRVLATKS